MVEIAASIEPVQGGRFELVNKTFIKMGRRAARARSFVSASQLRNSAGEVELHETGTFIR
ncbi:hypothetical protein [Bradyrhizobium sp. NBAIM08]|uniref:hypothetical protein n=1 Tax=Bradyrhizobium sp. NBAIM08 TaxID=2793815 RepID=UPI001CD39144|nr:hypothetical protein [Bradyrhizobium sp. NBAIM08]MCA1474172.1 hypothetical protein [Bradyrhizobium sp. NBAIM08]